MVFNDKIYAISGRGTDAVDVFGARATKFGHQGKLNFARSHATATVVGNRIYVVGGKGDDGSLLTSIEYLTDRWILAGTDF